MRDRVLMLASALVMASAGAWLAADAAHGQRYVPTSNPELPRIIYADSLTSVNDRCMVRSEKLNLRVRPVYANGTPLGFC